MSTLKIQNAQALDNNRLLVKFVNGKEKVYDCSHLFCLEVFRMLGNRAFFKTVKVDPGGYGISWNDDMDLSEYELWANGIEIMGVE